MTGGNYDNPGDYYRDHVARNISRHDWADAYKVDLVEWLNPGRDILAEVCESIRAKHSHCRPCFHRVDRAEVAIEIAYALARKVRRLEGVIDAKKE